MINVRVKMPDVLPLALTGLRIAATFAFLVIISTELIGAGMTGRFGLGNYVMEHGEAPARMDVVLAGAVIAGVWGYLINAGLSAAGRRLAGWSPAVRSA